MRPLPDTMAPLRPEDAPNARVIAPSAEVFPGGGWDHPWVAGEEADELVVEYEAGGSWATVEGRGALALVSVDGEDRGAVEIPGPGHLRTATHDRHGAHAVALRPEGDERLVGQLRSRTAVGNRTPRRRSR